MAKLVFGMNQSLDGYVDLTAFVPSPTLFRHFIEEAEGQAGSVYGRQMYEVMRYWDHEHPEWNAEEQAFAAAWRNQTKWVVSRSLKSVGPNARLPRTEGRARRGDRSCWSQLGEKPHRTWPDRRVSNLPAPRRAWSRQAIFRRTPATPAPYGS